MTPKSKRMPYADLEKLLDRMDIDFPNYTLLELTMALVTAHLYGMHLTYKDLQNKEYVDRMELETGRIISGVLQSLNATILENIPTEVKN